KPIVFAGRKAPEGQPSISVDGHHAARMLGQFLGRQGHRKILYLGFPAAVPDRERYRGLVEGLSEFDCELQRFDIEAPTIAEGTKASAIVLLGAQRYDAAVCFNDLVALGFANGASALGITIPQSLSVVGFDDIPFAAFAHPPLTTVNMQSERCGEQAMLMLLDCLNPSESKQPRNVTLLPQLQIRGSTMARHPEKSTPPSHTSAALLPL
ncbi:MAG: LacI family transcriptional regulator, partial [Brachymonas sp.]|nr:LacI family transcriptional regulator [Brachymonas sp.]